MNDNAILSFIFRPRQVRRFSASSMVKSAALMCDPIHAAVLPSSTRAATSLPAFARLTSRGRIDDTSESLATISQGRRGLADQHIDIHPWCSVGFAGAEARQPGMGNTVAELFHQPFDVLPQLLE